MNTLILVIKKQLVMIVAAVAVKPISVKEEVLSYLNERRKKLSVFKVYPRVMKVFRKYNCIIPSSASAERLFSVGGGIFTLKKKHAQRWYVWKASAVERSN